MNYSALRETALDRKTVSELTQQNLRDFEERLSSQAASKRKEKIVFTDKEKQLLEQVQQEEDKAQAEAQEAAENAENPEEQEQEQEGEGDAENPNEAEIEQDNEEQSIKSKAEIKSMSRASRKSYVLSLRNQLLKEKKERQKLEEKVKELMESRKSMNSSQQIE